MKAFKLFTALSVILFIASFGLYLLTTGIGGFILGMMLLVLSWSLFTDKQYKKKSYKEIIFKRVWRKI